jgi:hypothetical protein
MKKEQDVLVNRRNFLAQSAMGAAAGAFAPMHAGAQAGTGKAISTRLRAGAAKIVISPRPDMLPLPQAVLNGEAWYTRVRKDIYARAVAVNSGGKQLVLIALEGQIPSPNVVKERIARENSISADSVVLVSEHTHTQPNAVEPTTKESWGVPTHPNTFKYSSWLIDQVVKVGSEAITKMQPARYGFGSGNSYINASRDEQLPNGRWIFGCDFERPSDKTLGVIKLESLEGKLIAAVLNYAVHSTMNFRVKEPDGNMSVSGDLAGEISEYVEETYKADGTVCAWTIAAAANQTPLLSFFHSYEPDGTYVPDERYNHYYGTYMWDLCRHLGQKQGVDAVRIMKGITKLRDEMKLAYTDRLLQLPGTKVVGFDKDQLLDDRTIDDRKTYNVDVDTKYPVYLKLVRMGDLALFCSSGEVVCETGMRLKEASPFKHTVLLTCYHTQGAGYQVDKWGYENKTAHYYRNRLRGACYEPAMRTM